MSTLTPESSTRRPPRERKDPPAVRTVSARIAQLATMVDGFEDPRARQWVVDAFWDALGAEHGLVFAELAPDDAAGDACTMTFLHRAPTAWEGRAFILANKLVPPSTPELATMERLVGTDVLHASYVVPRAWRGTFRITAGSHDDPMANDVVASGLASMPDAPTRPWSAAPVVPMHRIDIDATQLAAPRSCWIHAAGEAAVPRALIVMFDGETWGERASIAPCIDHLVASGALPPCVVVAPSAGDTDQRFREMGDASPALTHFVTQDIRAWFERTYGSAPERTVIIGQSLGALAAARAACDVVAPYDAALLQSPSLWFHDDAPIEELTDLIAVQATQAAPARIALGIGSDEWVLAPRTRSLHARLDELGHQTAVTSFIWAGGHDVPCWLDGIAEHLPTLVRQDPA